MDSLRLFKIKKRVDYMRDADKRERYSTKYKCNIANVCYRVESDYYNFDGVRFFSTSSPCYSLRHAIALRLYELQESQDSPNNVDVYISEYTKDGLQRLSI